MSRAPIPSVGSDSTLAATKASLESSAARCDLLSWAGGAGCIASSASSEESRHFQTRSLFALGYSESSHFLSSSAAMDRDIIQRLAVPGLLVSLSASTGHVSRIQVEYRKIGVRTLRISKMAAMTLRYPKGNVGAGDARPLSPQERIIARLASGQFGYEHAKHFLF
ncbi:hypothetical protein KC326_g43 [Hortaea werneckii]|nr:hypothetical protein KC326_g43 [Hortaea werneckii]